MIDPELLNRIVCPESRSPLEEADAGLVARLNAAVAAGTLKNRVGRPVETPLEGGLVRREGDILYPIVDGIPKLLIDEGIPLDRQS